MGSKWATASGATAAARATNNTGGLTMAPRPFQALARLLWQTRLLPARGASRSVQHRQGSCRSVSGRCCGSPCGQTLARGHACAYKPTGEAHAHAHAGTLVEVKNCQCTMRVCAAAQDNPPRGTMRKR